MPSTPVYDESESIAYITSKNLSKGSIDYKGSKKISKESYVEITKNRPIKEDDLLIGMIGTIGEIARVKKTDLPFYGQNMYLVRFDQSEIDIKYFLHYFDSELMKDYFNSIKNNSAQGYLKAENIDEILIPLPSLSKQKEIAAVLDKYSDLINNISVGLPAEMVARRKQYEYYRDMLLTFKELESA
jgi:type I restriction enzyme S subunit